MKRLPGKSKRASTYAAIEPSSIVPSSEPATTISGVEEVARRCSPRSRRATVLEVQRVGQRPGRAEDLRVVLEASHHRPQQRQHDHDAHSTRKPCEKTLSDPPSVPRPRRLRRRGRPVRRCAGAAAPAGVGRRLLGGLGCARRLGLPAHLVLDPLAAAQPHHDGREDQGDDEQDDTDRGRVAGLTVAERLLVDVQRQ